MNNTLQLPMGTRANRRARSYIWTKPLRITRAITYTNFIQNLKNLLKYPQNYKNRFFPAKPHKENDLFIVLRNYILQTMNFQAVLKTLRKEKQFRSKQEIKAVAEFLSVKNDFFNNLKQTNPSTLYSMVNVLNIETFKQGDIIINYGDEGDKFYVVLEGRVAILKPKQIEKEILVKEFISYLRELKFNPPSPNILPRIEEYNKFNYDINLLRQYNYSYECVSDLYEYKSFIMEEYTKVYEGGEGTSFGEVALIQKTTRNATIVALTETNIASLDKEDYLDLMRLIQTKKYYEKVLYMKHNYLIVRSWSNQGIMRLINSLILSEYVSGDIVYQQGSISNGIYFVVDGSFEISMELYMNEDKCKCIQRYIKLNNSALFNWVESFHGKPPPKESEVAEFLINNRKEVVNVYAAHNCDDDGGCGSKKVEKVVLRKVNANECFGIEDAFELKKRFYTVTCTSVTGKIQSISMIELINLLIRAQNVSTRNIKQYIQEKKMFLLKQIKNYIVVKENDITNVNVNYQKSLEMLDSYNYTYCNSVNGGKDKMGRKKRLTKVIDKVSDNKQFLVNRRLKSVDHVINSNSSNNNNMNSINNALMRGDISNIKSQTICNSYNKTYKCNSPIQTINPLCNYYTNTNNNHSGHARTIRLNTQTININTGSGNDNNQQQHNFIMKSSLTSNNNYHITKTINSTTTYSLTTSSNINNNTRTRNNNNNNNLPSKTKPYLQKHLNIQQQSLYTFNTKQQQQPNCMYSSYKNSRPKSSFKATNNYNSELSINSECINSQQLQRNKNIYSSNSNSNNNNWTLYLNSKREDCKCISNIKSSQNAFKSFSEKEILGMTGVFRTYRKDSKRKKKMIFPQMCIVSPVFVGRYSNKKEKNVIKKSNKTTNVNKNKVKVMIG